jgi:hypothetical protein
MKRIPPLKLDVGTYKDSNSHCYGVTGLDFYKRQMKRMRLAQQGAKDAASVLQKLPTHPDVKPWDGRSGY